MAQQHKPTIAAAKRILRGNMCGGWAGFKHALMRELGIPESDYLKWDVPLQWQYAFRRATGWSDAQTRRQLKMHKEE